MSHRSVDNSDGSYLKQTIQLSVSRAVAFQLRFAEKTRELY